uniref:Protein-S-isoprenylcysteine O-methyltransferase n=1 Tax=Populus davidiana TaxID=266767 RepID=A0A6M2F507_9ROSI
MSFLKQILGDMKNEVSGLMMYSSCCPSFSEIFGYTACRQLSQMFLAVLFFHSSEYVLVAAIHGRSSVNLSSLLISKAYVFAMMFALLEYVVEIALFPGLKEYWWVSNLGLVMVIIGEITRKLAIVTAGQAFTHLIKVNHEEQHNLITHGVYRFVRHPSYTGFLIWSVGTQIMLCNPISTIGFAIVVWRFFSQRIPYEEFFLRQFFGSEYVEYASKTPSGVPFVK